LAFSQPRTMGRTVAGKARLTADSIISGPPSYRGDDLLLLHGLRVVTIALNLPGPAACARLRDLGAAVAKIEPPSGDPFEQFCPAWYQRLHEGMEVGRLDLKGDIGRKAMARRLEEADLLVTAQRPAALERLGLSPEALARFPKLCHVAITGHAPPDDAIAGHDLTYMAEAGLVAPPALPGTLFADMAGAERAVSTALALLLSRERGGTQRRAVSALADAAHALAGPRREGLTRPGALLGGGFAGYNLYAAKRGWVALAALEPHFAERLRQHFALAKLDAASLAELFAGHDAAYWHEWAREHDMPLAALDESSTNPKD
ncbi:MAG TPA: CoA transferase, partial [Usitatibacter sp.]|nr:CoA transferase [Usitatibacter sp.]